MLALAIVTFAASEVSAQGRLDQSRTRKLVIAKAIELAAADATIDRVELKQLLSTEGTAPQLVQNPSFAELISLAVNNNVVSSKEGVFTVGLTPFVFVSLANSESLSSQAWYSQRRNQYLRRIGGSLSLGGKSERVSRDSTGKALPARQAEDLGDIVNWELRYRLYGSRDRRDPPAMDVLMETITLGDIDGSSASYRALYRELLKRARKEENGAIYLDSVKTVAALKDTVLRNLILAVGKADAQLSKKIAVAKSKIDHAPVVTVFAGATRQRPEFGPDRWKAGVSGARGLAGWDATVNAVFRQVGGSDGAADTTSLDAGIKLTRTLFEGVLGFTEGCPVWLEYAYRQWNYAPSGGHRVISQASIGTDLPVTKSAKATFSVVWANHRDLIDKSDAVIGHVGLSYDFSGLFKKTEEKAK